MKAQLLAALTWSVALTCFAPALMANPPVDAPQTLGAISARRYTDGFLQPFIGDFGHLAGLVRELQRTDDPAEVRRLTAELDVAERAARELLELSPAAVFLKDSAGHYLITRMHEEGFHEVAEQIRRRVGRYLQDRAYGRKLETEGMDSLHVGYFEVALTYHKQILKKKRAKRPRKRNEIYFTYLAMPSGREEILQRVVMRLKRAERAVALDGKGAASFFKPYKNHMGRRIFELLVNKFRDDVACLEKLQSEGQDVDARKDLLVRQVRRLVLSILADPRQWPDDEESSPSDKLPPPIRIDWPNGSEFGQLVDKR